MTAAQIKTRFPEFANVSDSIITEAIECAELLMNETRWGGLYTKGLQFLTAHYVALDLNATSTAATTGVGAGGSVAQVSSETHDKKSYSYNVAQAKNASEAMYASTSYGQRFLTLMRQVGAGGCVV